MKEEYCKKICAHCKYRCVLRKTDGVVSFYGCFGRQKGYRKFIMDFSKSQFLNCIYAINEEGDFVSPLKEFGLPTDKEFEKTIQVDDRDFYRIINEQYPRCEYKLEMELAEWSMDEND